MTAPAPTPERPETAGAAVEPIEVGVVDSDGKSLPRCSKCGAQSGDDWGQCEKVCPMPGSPFYVDRLVADKNTSLPSDDWILASPSMADNVAADVCNKLRGLGFSEDKLDSVQGAVQEVVDSLPALAPPPGAPAPLAEVERLLDDALETYATLISATRADPLQARYTEYVKECEAEHDSARTKLNAALSRLSDRRRAAPGAGAVPADLVRLSERATAGEWRVETDTTLVWGDCRVDDDGYVERMGMPVVDAQQARGWSKDGQPDYERAQYNAALSAAAVNFVRSLLAASPPPDGVARDAGASGGVTWGVLDAATAEVAFNWAEILHEVVDRGLIYWEPNTVLEAVAKADMLRRCEGFLRPYRKVLDVTPPAPAPGAGPAGRHDGGVAQ